MARVTGGFVCPVWACLVLFGVGAHANAQAGFLHPLEDTAHVVRYETYTPGACLAAMQRISDAAHQTVSAHRDAWQQSFLENDTVLAAQRHTAAMCASSRDVRTAAPHELSDLTRVYWFAGDTARMQQAIAREFVLATTDSLRVTAVLQLLTRFLLSGQRDVALAEQRILPELGSATSLMAQAVRVQAYTALAYTFASSRRADAGDSTQAQIALALRSYAAMPAIEEAMLVDTIGPLFELGASEATERGDTALAHALLGLARKSLARIDGGAQYVHNTEEIVRYFGMRAPPIRVDYAYGAGAPNATASWPRPGRWTLVSPLPSNGYLAGFYRRLRKVIGDTLDLVFVAATQGNWRTRGPLTPEAEAKVDYDYLSRRWEIPGTVLVENRSYHLLPDGRRTPDPTQTPSLYYNTGLVIDPRGKIRAMVQQSTLVRFDLLLASLVRRGATSGGL